MKGFAIFAGVMIVCVAALVLGGGWLWESYGSDWVDGIAESGSESIEETKRFAEAHTQADCAPEAVRRIEACDGFICEAMVSTQFTVLCLAEARESPELCADVPLDPWDAVAWSDEACADVDARRDFCRAIFDSVRQFCAQRQPRTKEGVST